MERIEPAPVMGLTASRRNPTVKLARALRDRGTREREGLFLAEGARLVIEAAEVAAETIETVFVCQELLRSTKALEAAVSLEESGCQRVDLNEKVFRGITTRENPQGIAAIAQTRFQPIGDLDPNGGLCSVALINPQDAGNVGSILRTCDAVGVRNLMLVGNSVDPYGPRSVRGSMGAIFTMSMCRVDVDPLNDWIRRHAVTATAVTGEAGRSYRDTSYAGSTLLVFGSEREGLGSQVNVTEAVSIPMRGRSDSLNLATAAALVLYEAYHQDTKLERPPLLNSADGGGPAGGGIKVHQHG